MVRRGQLEMEVAGFGLLVVEVRTLGIQVARLLLVYCGRLVEV